MSEPEKMAAWLSVSIETLVDSGHWDDLTPEEQAAYLRSEAATEARIRAWERSFSGRWFAFTQALRDLRRSIGFAIAGYTPSDNDE